MSLADDIVATLIDGCCDEMLWCESEAGTLSYASLTRMRAVMIAAAHPVPGWVESELEHRGSSPRPTGRE